LLLSLTYKWAQDSRIALSQALGVVTHRPAAVVGSAFGNLSASAGRLVVGGAADICVFDPQAAWTVEASALRSQGHHTPFGGYELPGRVRATFVGGQLAYQS
jgi:dihydroorotase